MTREILMTNGQQNGHEANGNPKGQESLALVRQLLGTEITEPRLYLVIIATFADDPEICAVYSRSKDTRLLELRAQADARKDVAFYTRVAKNYAGQCVHHYLPFATRQEFVEVVQPIVSQGSGPSRSYSLNTLERLISR